MCAAPATLFEVWERCVHPTHSPGWPSLRRALKKQQQKKYAENCNHGLRKLARHRSPVALFHATIFLSCPPPLCDSSATLKNAPTTTFSECSTFCSLKTLAGVGEIHEARPDQITALSLGGTHETERSSDDAHTVTVSDTL